jgi:hypothetical protein
LWLGKSETKRVLFKIPFINYARKPPAFKPGDEWHPFGAKRRLFPACLAWPKVMTGMPEA